MNGLSPGANPQVLRWAILLAAVAIAVVAVHGPVLSAGALSFDDDMYLTKNSLVQNPSWSSCRRFLTEVLHPSTVRGYYQPLSMISLMLDYALGGRPSDLRQFHRTSLALHTANAVLIVVLLGLLSGRMGLAAGVGLLFGLHPLTVEPIAWVGERKTLLAAFFALLCLILYVHHARKNSWLLYLGCVLAYILALLSKPTSVPLPLLMLLMDYWPLQRPRGHIILEKLPLFVLGGIFATIACVSQTNTGHFSLPSEYGPGRVPLILCHNIVFYLHKILWPAALSCYYGYPEPLAFSHPTVRAGVMGTCVLIPLLLISLRWTRALLAGWLFFLLAILPALGVIEFARMIAADRHAYLPALGPLMTLTAVLVWFCGAGPARPARCACAALLLLVLGCAESATTRGYLKHWRDTVSLHEYMLTVTPEAACVHTNLAATLASWGRTEEALQHFRRALQIRPDRAPSHYNLGEALQSVGRQDEAVRHYRRAVQLRPDFAAGHHQLAQALWSLGRQDEALRHYRQAVYLQPDFAPAHHNLGMALAKMNQPQEALASLRQAVRLNPQSAPFLTDLAWILATHADPAVQDANEAVALAERAAELTGRRNAEVLDSLAAAYAAQGQFDLAVAHAEEALLRTRQDDYEKSVIRQRLELYRRGRPYRAGSLP